MQSFQWFIQNDICIIHIEYSIHKIVWDKYSMD